MALTKILLVCLVFALHSGSSEAAPSEKRVYNIDAAYHIENTDGSNFLYLFAEDKVQILLNKEFLVTYPRSAFIMASECQLDAAYVRAVDDKRFYYGEDSGLSVFYNSTGQMVSDPIDYSSLPEVLTEGCDGPDAAGRRGQKVYFFKDCAVISPGSGNEWEAPEDLQNIGLPCKVDAAWKDGDAMVVLKGPKFWKWESDGTVSDSEQFTSHYKLGAWE